MTLHVLIPAAGASSRMRGRDKLIEPVGGAPLLRRQCLLALGVAPNVTVALPQTDHPYHDARVAALAGLPVAQAHFPASARGLGGTIGAAAAAMPATVSHMMVILPDLVDLAADDLRALAKGLSDRPRRAVSETGVPGHPVVFPRRLFAALAQADPAGDGPREVLKTQDVQFIPRAGTASIDDLDTPEAWQAWRAKQQR